MTGEPTRRSARDRLVELGYLAGWRLLRGLPRGAAAAIFAAGADQAVRRDGPGVRRLAANLRRVVGDELPEAEFDALLRAAMRSYARYWLEAFTLPSRAGRQVVRDFQVENRPALEAAVAEGRGVVLALPHAGNWDAAGAWVATRGWPLATVVERLPSEGLYKRFVEYRRSLGMQVYPLTGGDRSVMNLLVERLAEGYVVPLVADRDLTSRGIEVDFFGGRARMPAGPAMLALRTGAPLFAVSLWYTPQGGRARVEGPLAVPDRTVGSFGDRARALTQDLADRFAAGIAEHPQDWHMLQRVWVDTPGTPDTKARRPGARRDRLPVLPRRAGGSAEPHP